MLFLRVCNNYYRIYDHIYSKIKDTRQPSPRPFGTQRTIWYLQVSFVTNSAEAEQHQLLTLTTTTYIPLLTQHEKYVYLF